MASGSESLLQCFWDLSSLEEEERLSAAQRMIINLEESHETDAFQQEINYCLTRLISGLASNRKGARHGYFTVLCELLSKYGEDVSVSLVLKLIREKLEHIGNIKGSEERGAYFGQVFALLALIQSDLPIPQTELPLVVKKLVAIATKKAPLRELCTSVLLRLVEGLKGQSGVVEEMVLPYMGLDCGWEKSSPEVILLLTALQCHFKQEVWYCEFIRRYWGSESGDFLIHDNFQKLSTILLTSSQSHPRIHSVWPHLFDYLRGSDEWAWFWSIVIDGSLLSSTRERKFLAYQLIEKLILPSLRIAEVGVVLTPTLFHQIHTSTRVVHHSLYEASNHLFKEIIQSASKSPVLCVGVWLQLLKFLSQFPESISHLQCQLSSEGVADYVDFLLTHKAPPTLSTSPTQWLLYQSSLVIKHLPHELKTSDWLSELALHLLILTHCNEGGVSLEDKRACQSKLMSLLNDFSKMKQNQCSGCDSWSVKMAKGFHEWLSAGEGRELAVMMSSSYEEAWLSAIQLVNELSEKDDADPLENVFLQLSSLLYLELIWERQEGGETVLNDLINCLHHMRTASLKTPTRKKRKSSASWPEMLVDIILSLLSREHQVWSGVVEKCFQFIVPHLTSESFHLIIKALEPQSVDDLMEDTTQEGDTDNNKEELSNGVTAKEDSEEEEEEEEEGEGGFFDPGAEFLADIRNALGDLAAVDSDQESIMSIDEEEMEALDEALSVVFQKKQEKAEKKKQKKSNKMVMMHFKMRLLHLMEVFIKHNNTNPLILDLLKPLFLLATAYQTNKTLSSLSSRAESLIEKLCTIKKYPRENIDILTLHSFLDELLTVQLYKAKKSTTPIITQSSMFLIRVLRGVCLPPPAVSPMATRSARKKRRTEVVDPPVQKGGLQAERVKEMCNKALHHMITEKNSSVPTGFFSALTERFPDISLLLLPGLVNDISTPGNHFRLMLGYGLINSILKQSKEQVLSDAEIVDPLISRCVADLKSTKVLNDRPILECIQTLVKNLKSHDKCNGDSVMQLWEELIEYEASNPEKTGQLTRNILQLL